MRSRARTRLCAQVVAGLSLLMGVATGCKEEKANFNSKPIIKERSAEDSADRFQDQADAKAINTLKFTAGDIKDAELSFDPGLGAVYQTLVLEQKDAGLSGHKQIERPRIELAFRQGYDASELTDKFDAFEPGKVDILMVVDDSESMSPIQSLLAQTLDDFLSNIQGLNWRIAVNTTSSPCLRETKKGVRLLSKEAYDLNPQAVTNDYRELIKAGASAFSTERGIESATLGMQGKCKKGDQAWRRNDAKPVVLIISDEKNCGSATNEGCPGDPYLTGDKLIEEVPEVTVYALLLLAVHVPLCPDLGGYDNFDPVNYKSLVNKTGGFYEEICQASYRDVMTRISKDVGKDVRKTYSLSNVPINDPVVMADGQVLTDGYFIKGNVVFLTKDLGSGVSEIEVQYKHSAKEKFSEFDLPRVPDQRTFVVKFDDKIVDPGMYEYHADSGKLVFGEMPPDRVLINIVYHVDLPIGGTFSFNEHAVPGTITASVAGTKVPPQDLEIDELNHTVTIFPPPLDGQEVVISFENPFDRITEYPIGQLGSFEGVVARDRLTGEVLQASILEDKVIFDANDVYQGRKVELEINVAYSKEKLSFSVPLAFTPMEGSIEIITEQDPGACPFYQFGDDSVLEFQCDDDDFNLIELKYQYVVDYTNQFELPGDADRYAHIAVFVDDQEITQYELSGTLLTIDKVVLPIGAEVKVIVLPEP